MEKDELIIDARDVHYSYITYDINQDRHEKKAVDGISLGIRKGSYTAILGPNGSGKSTFAKLIDILEMPSEGSIVVFGIDTRDEEHFWDIRENCSYVFQNPDNQIVGTTVEEDVAFGPENLGVPLPELRKRVDDAIRYVGLQDYSKKQAAYLSGGQKQKLAIAGALAMQPKLLILDESTAMLDPISRDELLEIAERMNREQQVTLVTITHDMSEAIRADEIFVLNNGKVVMHGRPNEVFSHPDEIAESALELPETFDLGFEVAKLCGRSIGEAQLENEDICAEAIADMLTDLHSSGEDRTAELGCGEIFANVIKDAGEDEGAKVASRIMEVRGLSFAYEKGGRMAISDLNLDIYRGEILAIVGRSGCGKTTLISHLNGIFKPTEGDVIFYGADGSVLRASEKKDIALLRRHVGLVFQYPEYQLFADTVEQDIAYGPRKLGMSEEEIKLRVKDALSAVGLKPEVLKSSPFDLSGGQKRRVAMAGIIAMSPEVLVLDEPAAGLDPKGRREMFAMISNLRDRGTTVVLVTHNMDEAARNADRIICISGGRLAAQGTVDEIYENEDKVSSVGLSMPKLFSFSRRVRDLVRDRLPGVQFGRYRAHAGEEAALLVEAVSRYLRSKDASARMKEGAPDA